MVRLSILCLFLSVPVAAQTPPSCMSADELDASLIDWYGERAVMQSRDGHWVLWQNAESESWTVVEYLESGMACVAAHGTKSPNPDDLPEMIALQAQ